MEPPKVGNSEYPKLMSGLFGCAIVSSRQEERRVENFTMLIGVVMTCGLVIGVSLFGYVFFTVVGALLHG